MEIDYSDPYDGIAAMKAELVDIGYKKEDFDNLSPAKIEDLHYEEVVIHGK